MLHCSLGKVRVDLGEGGKTGVLRDAGEVTEMFPSARLPQGPFSVSVS